MARTGSDYKVLHSTQLRSFRYAARSTFPMHLTIPKTIASDLVEVEVEVSTQRNIATGGLWLRGRVPTVTAKGTRRSCSPPPLVILDPRIFRLVMVSQRFRHVYFVIISALNLDRHIIISHGHARKRGKIVFPFPNKNQGDQGP